MRDYAETSIQPHLNKWILSVYLQIIDVWQASWLGECLRLQDLSRCMKIYCFCIVLLLFGSCNKRSTCAAYQEVGAFGIPDENYEPSGYIIVERNKRTGRVKKVGKVRKVQYTSRTEKSKLFRNERKFIKDGELFPDAKKSKKTKSAKRDKKSEKNQEQEEEPLTE